MTPAPDRRAAVLAALPKHLRTLASAVRGLTDRRHRNPEAMAIARDEIAAALTSLAALIEAE